MSLPQRTLVRVYPKGGANIRRLQDLQTTVTSQRAHFRLFLWFSVWFSQEVDLVHQRRDLSLVDFHRDKGRGRSEWGGGKRKKSVLISHAGFSCLLHVTNRIFLVPTHTQWRRRRRPEGPPRGRLLLEMISEQARRTSVRLSTRG